MLHKVIFTTFSHLFIFFFSPCPLESVHTHTALPCVHQPLTGNWCGATPRTSPPGDWQKNKCGIFYSPPPCFFFLYELMLEMGILLSRASEIENTLSHLHFLWPTHTQRGGRGPTAQQTTHCQCRKQVMMTKMVKKKKKKLIINREKCGRSVTPGRKTGRGK